MIIILSLSLLMILTVGYAAFQTNLSITAKGNIKLYTAEDYVTDGLFAFYDGIENTSSGHGAPTDTWYNNAKDLTSTTSSQETSLMNNFSSSSWTNDNGLKFNGNNTFVDTGFTQASLGDSITISTIVNLEVIEPYKGIWGYHDGTPWWGIYAQTYGDGSGMEIVALLDDNTAASIIINREDLLNKKVEITAVMQSGVGLTVYLNGNLYGSFSTSANIVPFDSNTENNHLIIGRSHYSNDSGVRSMQGTMYNFMVYKKALAEEEVKQNYKVNKYRYQLNE